MSCVICVFHVTNYFLFKYSQKSSDAEHSTDSTKFQRLNSILLSKKQDLEDKYAKEVVSHLSHCQKAQQEFAARNKQLARLKTTQLNQLESTRSNTLYIPFASAAVAVNPTIGELCKQKDVILSSTVEGLLQSKDAECVTALHNLSRDKDHECTIALQQMCAKKDAIMNQEKIAMENCCRRRSTQSFDGRQLQGGAI